MPLASPTEKQSRLIWFALTGLAVALLVALVVGLVWGLGQVLRILSPVLWPLAIAGVIAYLLDPVVGFLERRRLSRPKAIATVFVAAFLVVAMVCSIVVPQLVDDTRQLAAKIPDYKIRLENKANRWISAPPDWAKKFLPHPGKRAADPVEPPKISEVFTNPVLAIITETNLVAATEPAPRWPAFDNSTLRSATDWISKVLPAAGGWVARAASIMGSVFGVIAGLALIPVYAFYLLLEKRGIKSSWTDYLPVSDSSFKDELVFVLSAINGYLIAFFRGQVLVAMCDAALYTTGFFLIGLPYAILIGASALVLTLIPFLGAITICVTALIISVVTFGDWLHPALVLGVFAVVQTLEGLVISPRIMGGRVGLHPLTIIIAVMAGTTLLGGILGGILAIPLAAALRVIMFRYIWKKSGPTLT